MQVCAASDTSKMSRRKKIIEIKEKTCGWGKKAQKGC